VKTGKQIVQDASSEGGRLLEGDITEALSLRIEESWSKFGVTEAIVVKFVDQLDSRRSGHQADRSGRCANACHNN
jgi:hypothetical protein